MIVLHYCLLRRIKACLVKELRRRGDKLVKRLNEIIPDKEPKHKVEKLKYKKQVKQPRNKNKSELPVGE